MFDSITVKDYSESVIASMLKTMKQLQATMDLSWTAKKDYRIINTVESLKEICDEMQNYKFIAVDTETTGLNIFNVSHDNPIRDRVVGICLSWKKDQGVYIPLEHTRFKNIDKKICLEMLKPLLETKEIVTHNGIFDGRVFYQEGILLNIKHDTMILQFNIDGDIHRNHLGLKDLTSKIFGYTPIELEDIFEYSKDYGMFKFVEEDVAKYYACADPDNTLALFYFLITKINPIHLSGYKKDIQLARVVMRSEYEGKYLDMKSLKLMHDLFVQDKQKLEDLIYSFVGRELAYTYTGKFDRELYRFNVLSPAVLQDVCFNKLEYPVKAGKSINKAMLKYWADQKTSTPSPVIESLFKEDLYSETINYPDLGLEKDDQLLLSKSMLLNCKYPLTYLIQAYRKVTKSIGSFFEPLLKDNYESKYFTSINMTRAATFRLIDRFQTLDGSLKTIVSPPDWAYMFGFDFAQIELRVMAGLSGDKETIDMLDDKEADGHRVFASKILKCRPEEITDKVRKKYKAVNFGIPYGRGVTSMVEQAYGIGLSEYVFKKAKSEMTQILTEWKVGNSAIWNRLEAYRDDAITPIPQNEIPWHLNGNKWGRVLSPSGRARYFNLDDLTQSKIASIRRQAGNFPIQEYARDIFAEAAINLDACLRQEGLVDIKVKDGYSALGYHFENKVIFEAYIHDEIQMIVDKSINPKWLMKKVYENCVIKIPSHPTYYVGASVINNWHESKAGDHEVPIQWLENLPVDTPKFVEYDPNCQRVIDEECKAYIKERTFNEFKKLNVDLSSDVTLTCDKLLQFTSYYLIERITKMFPPVRKVLKNVSYNDYFVASLESCFGVSITIADASFNDDKQEETSIVMLNFWNEFGDEENEESVATEILNTVGQDTPKMLSDNFKLFREIFKGEI